jgi:hypothetical protein
MSGISRDVIMRALRRLGELALAEGLTLELCLYGGTALMLAYGNREATQDVDATIKPKEAGLRIAKRVAQELNLEEKWLNDEVWRFFAPVGARWVLPLEIPGLKLYVATASYLLAMKALACRRPGPSRRGDLHDLKFLIHKMEIKSLAEIEAHIDRYFPDDRPTEQQCEIIKGIIEEANREHKK